MSWITCIVDEEYEIFSEFPFQVRKKKNQRIVKEYLSKGTGYIKLNLNKKPFLKHRVIALQFIKNPDPENFKFVDHCNHIKTDNRIENLRWCSQQQNMNNRSDQIFIDEILC